MALTIRRQVAFTFSSQEVIALSLGLELGGEFLGRYSCQGDGLLPGTTRLLVINVHGEISLSIIEYLSPARKISLPARENRIMRYSIVAIINQLAANGISNHAIENHGLVAHSFQGRESRTR